MTTVHDLSTGTELTMDTRVASEAVLWAYFQSIGRRNTFEYAKLYNEYYHKLSWGRHSVAMGDFATLL